jgi:hypothetical protein
VSEHEKLQEQYRTNANLRARIDLHERFSTSTLPYPRRVFDGYTFGDEADVLEVGCGDGMLWRENLDDIPQGWHLTLKDSRPYEDSLEVTELEPLLAFVRSRGDVEQHELEPLRRAAESEIAARGSFHGVKETARVRARKP